MPHDGEHIRVRDEIAGEPERIVVWDDFYRCRASAYGTRTGISGLDGER
jgi:hypothetical protein